VSPAAPAPDQRAIRFRIRFTVPQPQATPFLDMLEREYVPALAVQPGFRAARVLSPFPEQLSDEIGAVTRPGVYELEFDFTSEAARRDWVAQPVHDRLWGRAVELSAAQEWSGFFAVAGAESTGGEG